MRSALPFLAALLLVPSAAAQGGVGNGERVAIQEAEFPPVVVAERPFFINVTVQNREAAAANVVLFATLYEGASGTPCEGARAVQPLSKFQKSVALPASGTVRVEGERDHWTQVVNRSRVPADGLYEVCVWARQATCPGGELPACFLDHHSQTQRIRLRNQAPAAKVTWDPLEGTVATRFTFGAMATDADGDPLQVTWDFGDGIRGQGQRPVHQFPRAGTYAIAANVTDGFDFVVATARLQVREASAASNGVPGFDVALVAAALLTAALGRAARPR